MQTRVVELQIEQKEGLIIATSKEHPQILIIATNWQQLALDVQAWLRIIEEGDS